MSKKERGIINIASGKSTKIKDFLTSLTEKQITITSDNTPPNRLVANIDHLNKALS